MGLFSIFKKEILLQLLQEQERYFLRIFYDHKPCAWNKIAECCAEIRSLAQFFPIQDASEAEIPVGQLQTLLRSMRYIEQTLPENSKLRVSVQDAVLQMRFTSVPEDFQIRWNLSDGCLIRSLPSDSAELSDGWYRYGKKLFRFLKLSPRQSERIRQERIPAEDIPYFLSNELPKLKENGVFCACDIAYSEESVLDIFFDAISENTLRLCRTWKIPTESIRNIPLQNHILVDNILYAALSPKKLDALLPWQGNICVLRDEEIPQFLDNAYPILQPWMRGDFQKLQTVHAWIEPPYRWILRAYAEQNHGIGRKFAEPIACIGEELLNAKALLQCLKQPYTRLHGGWVRRKNLCALGMNLRGEFADGTSAAPMPLTTRQLLYCGDENLQGIWQELRVSGMPWRESALRRTAALEHWKYLCYWGIHGGLTGGYASAVVYLPDMLESLLSAAPEAKILLIAPEQDLRDIKRYMSFASVEAVRCHEEGQVYAVSYARISHTDIVMETHWDALLCVEPDAQFIFAQEMRTSALTRVPAALRMGFFFFDSDTCSEEVRKIQGIFLDIPQDEALLPLLIRDPARPLPLPIPYAMQPQEITPISESSLEFSGNTARPNYIPKHA